MLTLTAKVFTHGGSQAVRLPKECRFAESEVYVRRVGDEVILSPRPPATVQGLIDALADFEPGVALEREQPGQQVRQAIRPRR